MTEIAWLFQHCSDKYNLLSSECKSDSEGHYLSGNNHTSIAKPLNHRPFALSQKPFRLRAKTFLPLVEKQKSSSLGYKSQCICLLVWVVTSLFFTNI